VPHFTGPIAYSRAGELLVDIPPALCYSNTTMGTGQSIILPEFVDFRQGKLYPNERPGLGVILEPKLLKQIGEVTQR